MFSLGMWPSNTACITEYMPRNVPPNIFHASFPFSLAFSKYTQHCIMCEILISVLTFITQLIRYLRSPEVRRFISGWHVVLHLAKLSKFALLKPSHAI